MTKEQLATLIEARYKTRRAFIEYFNSKFPTVTFPLDETSLSRFAPHRKYRRESGVTLIFNGLKKI